MKALIIIDMQKGSFTPATPRLNAEEIIRKINLLSAKFRAEGEKVIFIQHDGRKENNFIPGTNEWRILSSLNVETDDVIVSKTANDSFYKTNLVNILQQNSITDLFITGCATDFCVDSTIHSALNNDFNVFIVKDCHTTADRPHLSAKKIIEHYNWMWENLIPTNGIIKLVLSDELGW